MPSFFIFKFYYNLIFSLLGASYRVDIFISALQPLSSIANVYACLKFFSILGSNSTVSNSSTGLISNWKISLSTLLSSPEYIKRTSLSCSNSTRLYKSDSAMPEPLVLNKSIDKSFSERVSSGR